MLTKQELTEQLPSKTFCILPWIHIYANPDGSVLPCCIGNHHHRLGNVSINTVKEVWNNDQYKSLRMKMLRGETCEECSACNDSETKGILSTRQEKNIEFQKYIPLIKNTNEDGSLDELSLRYFDVRWSNICNFKCRSCSASYSSSWATEDNNSNDNKRKVFMFAGGDSNDKLYDQFLPHFKDIETFYFAGGEPLLTDKHYDILEHLIEIKKTDVKLFYNTNLSTLFYKNKSVVDLWNHFSKVTVSASLDSWGDRAEYIREGTDWMLIKNNIKTIKQQTPHVNLQTNTVVSIFNVLTLQDFFEHLFQENLFDPSTIEANFYNLVDPYYYSMQILPEDLKIKTIDKLKSSNLPYHINRKLSDTIRYIQTSQYNNNLHRNFIKVTDHYDGIRNRKLLDTFPELTELYSVSIT